jgi:alkanesulfonate monooxygenase SsuD/methylene tetrahydromethanopterin reductase-like flavin-dependent oxidoreductase (luciferase family)
VEFVANLTHTAAGPARWACQREAEGWDVLSVADHLFTSTRAYPHVWVAATALATATSRPRVMTAFVNNLLHHPVDVAQAALTLQEVSGGRFDLGLGAGWARDEVLAAGHRYPSPRERADAFVEAAQIVRSLTTTGACAFKGEHYAVDVPLVGSAPASPPRLIAALGGPRTIRGVTPHVDAVEVKPSSASTRGGSLDFAEMAKVTEGHLADLVAQVREVRPGIDVGMFVFCSAGEDTMTSRLAGTLAGGLYGRFFGPPGHVAEGLAWLSEQGVAWAQVSPLDEASFARLAPLLF